MKCGKCGAEVPASTYVCPNCGKRYTPGKYCVYCKAVLPASATVCHKCRRPQPDAPQTYYQPNQQPSPTAPFTPQKKKSRWYIKTAIVLVVLVVIGGICNYIAESTPSRSKPVQAPTVSKQDEKVEATPEPTPSAIATEKPTKSKEEYIHSDFDTSEYTFISADLLYEYGQYFAGKKVGTVITVESKDRSMLKARTENNDSIFFSINCDFTEPGLTSSFSEGDIVTVVGTVDEKALIGSTTTLNDCTIVGLGEVANEIEDTREICEQQKANYEAEQLAQHAAERDEYKSQCVSVDYSDVERNPDNYKGKRIAISGTVEQVQEGWFDTVTLRVNSGGNMWYVTYMREEGEGRILEGDYINCYGECDGVTSYTSVLGNQVTIPSLSMEYYEIG